MVAKVANTNGGEGSECKQLWSESSRYQNNLGIERDVASCLYESAFALDWIRFATFATIGVRYLGFATYGSE